MDSVNLAIKFPATVAATMQLQLVHYAPAVVFYFRNPIYSVRGAVATATHKKRARDGIDDPLA